MKLSERLEEMRREKRQKWFGYFTGELLDEGKVEIWEMSKDSWDTKEFRERSRVVEDASKLSREDLLEALILLSEGYERVLEYMTDIYQWSKPPEVVMLREMTDDLSRVGELFK